MSILFLKSSPRGEASFSSRVADVLVKELSAKGASVITHDLPAEELAFLDGELLGAWFAPDSASDAAKARAAQSDVYVQEFLDADIVVIATGMINFAVSAPLKTWIDNISRAGKTFKYTEAGAVGLASPDKKVILVEASGGIYSEGALSALDFQHKYLTGILGFFGITDFETIRIEGTAYGPEAAEKAFEAAVVKAKELATTLS